MPRAPRRRPRRRAALARRVLVVEWSPPPPALHRPSVAFQENAGARGSRCRWHIPTVRSRDGAQALPHGSGPTPVPPEVLAAGLRPSSIIAGRTSGPDAADARSAAGGLRTQNDVLLSRRRIGCVRVGHREPPSRERVLVVTAGAFGDRWCSMAGALGADVHELRYSWGETPQPDDLRSRLGETGAEVVVLVHSETSTGVVADVQSLARVARDAGALVVVDAVSSLGAVPLETDAWGLDVVVAGSQKALMTPPGSRSRRSPTVRGSGRDVRRCRATTSTGSACAPRSSPARPVHSAVTLVAPSTPPCDAPRRRA